MISQEVVKIVLKTYPRRLSTLGVQQVYRTFWKKANLQRQAKASGYQELEAGGQER